MLNSFEFPNEISADKQDTNAKIPEHITINKNNFNITNSMQTNLSE